MPVILEVFFILVVAIGLLAYSGWGLTVWLTPKKQQPWFYILVLFLGLFLIDSITHLTLIVNIPGYRAIWILLVIASTINILALIFKRSQFRRPNKFEAIAFLAAIPALILVLAPMLTQSELLPLVTSSNADSISHTATTDWLKQHSFSDNIPQDSRYPVNVPIQGKVKTDVRLGFHFYQMYIDLLTKQQAHNTFSIVAAISFYLWGLATGFFASSVLQLKKTPASLSILLFSLNSLPLWIAFGGYGPQILGMGLMIMAFAWWTHALQEFNWRSLTLAAAFSAAFAGIYSDVLPYLIAPVGLLFLILLIQNRKNPIRLRQIISTAFFAGILTLLLNPLGWYRALSRSTNVATRPNLGNLDWLIDIRQVFGLAHFERNISIANSTLEKTLLSVLVTILIGFIIYGFFKLSHQAKTVSLCFILPHLVTLIWFLNKPHSAYLYFKGWSIGLFIYVIFLALGLFITYENIKSNKYYSKIAYVVFALLIFVLVRSSINQIDHVVENLAVTPNMVELSHWKNDIAADERIYIASGDIPIVPVFWMAYFLIDHPIHYSNNMVYTHYKGTSYQNESWILREKKALPFWDDALWQENIFKENDTFVLSSLDWKNRTFTIPEIHYPLDVNVSNQFQLLGYDINIDPDQLETSLNLTLFWQVEQQTDQNYKLFIHLLDQNGSLVRQLDAYPYNSTYHTSYWQPGEIVTDSYELMLGNDFRSGNFTLKAGWYLEQTGERLSVEQNGIMTEDSSILLTNSVEIGE